MLRNLASVASERSPEAVYRACVDQDDSAIDEFVRRYRPELAGYARRHGAEDPEGMANLAMFETIRRLGAMRRLDEPAVRAYLYRALKSRLADEHRAPLRELPLEDSTASDSTESGPEESVLQQLALHELLDLLTPAERDVVSHRFVAGYTSVETAARVGRSPAAVRRLQANALIRLRVALAVAFAIVAIGTGYWLLSRSQPAHTNDPIGDPTESQLPEPDSQLTGEPQPGLPARLPSATTTFDPGREVTAPTSTDLEPSPQEAGGDASASAPPRPESSRGGESPTSSSTPTTVTTGSTTTSPAETTTTPPAETTTTAAAATGTTGGGEGSVPLLDDTVVPLLEDLGLAPILECDLLCIG